MDCTDANRAAEFWSAVLGVAISHRYGEYVFLGEVAPGVRFTLQEVPEVTQAKSPIHFDIAPTDYQALVDRVVELGGGLQRRVIDEAYTLAVMTDPDGNEFCINQRLAESLAAPGPARQASENSAGEGR